MEIQRVTWSHYTKKEKLKVNVSYITVHKHSPNTDPTGKLHVPVDPASLVPSIMPDAAQALNLLVENQNSFLTDKCICAFW